MGANSTANDEKQKKMCDYVIFSPINNDASPNGYTTPFTPAMLKSLAGRKVIDRKVMALGGIDLDNIRAVEEARFGGAILLGAIWNRFNIHTTQDFKELINHFRKIKKSIG